MNSANYPRGYGQTGGQQRSPATPRRGAPNSGGAMGIPHPGQQGMANAQYMANLAAQRNMPPAAAAAAAANEAALRRSRKPTDKTIPDGVEDVIIGEGVQQYKSLREVEKRLDAAMIRKRLDIQDSISRTVKRFRTLRIWISNTVENPSWQSGVPNGSSVGSERYKVRIEGRLLDDDSDPTQPSEDSDDEDDDLGDDGTKDGDAVEQGGAGSKKSDQKRQRQRLSHFFKSITIDFDKNPSLKPEESAPIRWIKPQLPPTATSLPPTADFDSIQFSRTAPENVNITISLVRDESPERYKLSNELADVLDVEEESRSGIVMGIWDYAKAMGLQEDEEKRQVRCDHRLKAVFNRDQIFFPQIPDAVNGHITALEPIKLDYTIRLDQEFHTSDTPPGATVYDVRVAVDDPLRAKMIAFSTDPRYTTSIRQIGLLDDQLTLVIQAIMHSKARHSFYSALAEDPVTFIRRWLNSQRRDLETILGEATRGGGEDGSGPEFRRGGSEGVWSAPVTREAVRYMLARPDAATGTR